jgi:hypothetical protein
MIITPTGQSHTHKAIRVILCLTIVLSSLPSQGSGVSSAQSANQADKNVQSRPDTPHKNLPSPKNVLDEGKGLKKTLPKDPTVNPPKLCRFRDLACQENQRRNGGQISSITNAPDQRHESQTARQASNSEGSWFKHLGKKISGALSGTSLNALVNPSGAGNSLLPVTTTPAAAAPPPPPPAFASLNEAKLDPHYRIGTGGEDLFSGNYHWSAPLVSLPGRNGLDLNLTLHYNSLQWVRFNNTMYYDPDWRTSYPYGLATGFNLGFPEIESGFTYDGTTSYLVTLPSGYRVPMRRVYLSGSTSKFEAVDGSYFYLVVVGSTAPILYAPDGTIHLRDNL